MQRITMNPRLAIGMMVLAIGAPQFSMAGETLRFLKGDVDIRAQAQVQQAGEEDSQIWLIQFKSAITPSDHGRLQAAGASVYRYVPDDALVVRGSRAALSRRLASRLQGVMPFKGDFKLSENLPTASVFSARLRGAFALTVLHDSEVPQVLTALERLDSDVQVLQRSGRHLDVSLSVSALPRVAAIPGVEFLEARPEVTTLQMDLLQNEDQPTPRAPGDYTGLSGYETGTKVMNFEAAWTEGFMGQGQTVGVADTGLDRGEGRLSGEFAGAVTKGYAVGVGAKGWQDPMGHGTHVAGSVAGRGLASSGVFLGGASQASLIPQGMWSPIIDNLTVPPKLERLFVPAYQDGARVHTNSWGAAANLGAYDSMAVQADEFLWNNPQMLVIFAAGNSGADKDKNGVIDHGSVSTPGTAKNVLTVGASENLESVGGIQRQIKDLGPAKESWSVEPIWSSKLSDNPNGIACFSSRGPTRDGRLKPDVVAPGTNILSAMSQEPGANPLWGKYNDQYTYSGGTSMSAPLVAGAAAVAREVLIEKHGRAEPSGALVKAVLLHSAVDLFPGQYGQGTPTQELTRRPNNDQGYGRVDMAKLIGIGSATRLIESAGVATGEMEEQVIQVSPGQTVLANLVYFDAPGTASAARALVNNLDLVLVNSQGQESGSRDTVNNHEILELSNLAAGTYRLQVRGVNVPMGKAGKQPYALVFTVQ